MQYVSSWSMISLVTFSKANTAHETEQDLIHCMMIYKLDILAHQVGMVSCSNHHRLVVLSQSRYGCVESSLNDGHCDSLGIAL